MNLSLRVSETHLQAVGLELNKLLADEFILYIQTRNCHWNFEGPNACEMHKFYARQVEQLTEMIDQVAQQVRAMGHYAEARLEKYLKLTNLSESPAASVQHEQLMVLLASHETIIDNLHRLIRLFADRYGDVDSSDFASRLLRKHEDMAWLLRVYLM